MKQLYKLFGWQCAKDFGHLYDGFKYAMNNWNDFLIKYSNIPDDIQPFLKKNIEKRLKPQIVTVRAKVEITCFTFEGVDAIKKSLKAGLAIINKNENENENENKNNNDDMNLKIKLVAPPLYIITIKTYEPEKGKKLVNKVVDIINQSITKSNGTLTIKQTAQVIAVDHDLI
eukprot:152584_1